VILERLVVLVDLEEMVGARLLLVLRDVEGTQPGSFFFVLATCWLISASKSATRSALIFSFRMMACIAGVSPP
jgi:hypothetical protein